MLNGCVGLDPDDTPIVEDLEVEMIRCFSQKALKDSRWQEDQPRNWITNTVRKNRIPRDGRTKTQILRIIQSIHVGHFGTQSSIRWIFRFFLKLQVCQGTERANNTEQLMVKEIPTLPWQKVAIWRNIHWVHSSTTEIHGFPILLETYNVPQYN